ncbi:MULTISPECIES: cation:proton antiporter regulatory subunit [unclassified Archaeoglobus]|jgi:TrkA domain protein|uniref:cation:proton antiporter regulatory subunit n=1 Tax=unclassified Archaeoglobus TaxID=2643606 RepID=UPI0025BA3ECE|nr:MULTISPECIES: TrkA C-terminal domain-containing protein [unclassified Archaeoglobus]
MGVELPGVGTKYEIDTAGGRIAVVFLEGGEIQLYILERGCEKPCVVNLTNVEARRLGSILSGAIFEREEEGVEVAFPQISELRITVHTYTVSKSIAGKTIEELKIRKNTGVTIIAISKEDRNIISPSPSTRLEEGDIIVVIGEHDQIRRFEELILGR